MTVVRDGKHVTQRVTTGLAGDSSTIVLSGLKAGEEVVLPSLSSSGGASLTSRLSSRLGARSGGIGGGSAAVRRRRRRLRRRTARRLMTVPDPRRAPGCGPRASGR